MLVTWVTSLAMSGGKNRLCLLGVGVGWFGRPQVTPPHPHPTPLLPILYKHASACVLCPFPTSGGQVMGVVKAMCPCGSLGAEPGIGGGGNVGNVGIIFLGADMVLACIRAMLERTASQPSRPACRHTHTQH